MNTWGDGGFFEGRDDDSVEEHLNDRLRPRVVRLMRREDIGTMEAWRRVWADDDAHKAARDA